MPGNPFKRPSRGGVRRATPRRPGVMRAKSYVRTPEMPNGIKSRTVNPPAPPAVKSTTKARKSRPMPRVSQGASMGTPGRTGSRPGARS